MARILSEKRIRNGVLKTKKRNLHVISISKDLLLQTFKIDERFVGIADESDLEPQAPKKQRRGAAKYGRNW